MATTLTLSPVPGSPGTFAYRPEFGSSLDLPVTAGDLAGQRDSITDLLSSPGRSPYTPELTADVLAGIRRRAGELRDESLATVQSDFLARGGTGSSLEAMTRLKAREAADRMEGDQSLQFLLASSDRAAEDRRFGVGTALDLYRTDVSRAESALGRQFGFGQLGFQADQDAIAREHEQRLADKYMAQLAAARAAERKARRRQGIAGGLGSLAGAGLGAALALPTGGMSVAGGAFLGSQFGGAGGDTLGFLFS